VNCLENLGLVTRVVGPLGGRHRSKQHRYALVTDTEAMKAVVMSTAKEEILSVLQALHQIEENLENQSVQAEEMTTTMVKTRQFYEEMNKILDLMNRYTMKELIELLDRNKK
jgi:tryptophan synthase beta subunit